MLDNAQKTKAFFEDAAMQNLLRVELRALAPILSGIYGNHGLFVRAHPAAPGDLPEHLLGCLTTLAVAPTGPMLGDLCCGTFELPFLNDSLNLFVAQHACELGGDAGDCAQEIARVLAPEGIALILGFNPLGSWRPWLALQSRKMQQPIQLHSAQYWRRCLLRERIDTLQIRFPGVFWPRSPVGLTAAPESNHTHSPMGRFSSSWLLLARKRRATLTPMRLRTRNREFGLQPGLLPGAHRTRA